jgi:glycerate kinase
MQSGFDRVAHETGLADALRHADLVLTGEGRLDAQSASGKAALGVARLAREAGSIVVALAGGIQDDPGGVSPLLDGAFPIHREPRPLAVALSPELTEREIRATAHAVASLVGAATRDTGGAHG